ncbi:MAG: adenylate kinase, partial [Rhodococcus sp.]|nr:adenylate kinase [Rhodococcus sp. (in: high G+C Gram-positive bacteria)]
ERMLARGREDDKEDVIRNRLHVYRDETAPLLDHYKDELVSVDAIGEVDEVNARALAALGK